MLHLILGWAIRNVPSTSSGPKAEAGYTAYEGSVVDFASHVLAIQGAK